MKTRIERSWKDAIAICLLVIWVSFALGCSTKQTAGGTASEGESFVYGNVQDSSQNTAPIARIQRVALNAIATVVLSRLTYTDTGLASTWTNSVTASATGYFEIPVLDSGIYSLEARYTNGSATVYDEILYQQTSVDLGKLGLFHPVSMQGSIMGTPACTSGLRLSVLGLPGLQLLGRDSLFHFDSIPVGHSTLLAQCGDTIQQWHVMIPGRCSRVTLDSIPWTTRSSAALGNASYRGFGQNPSLGHGWSWRQGGELTLGADCKFIVDAGHGAGNQGNPTKVP